ncbi:head GIN domain-containing protein [Marivirga arenosa]|uniref:Head GIN domain-containing protein n=1 Tax=Marivirga arenosa TaxID=3059076 RepID=A0AA49JCG2_9BACT|nr:MULTISPECIES: head GIN domain-containing protein [unclassified Marivirga]WKK79161.2 head GIN domain-containing protein [Marivirga sp. BKB1-2]WKK85771.1 head GIN domain-containing protein [Marivirga sp. ABR2-2]
MMMKKLGFSILLLLMMLSTTSYSQVNNYNINLVEFNSISVNSAYTVYVKQSNKEEIKIKAEKEIYEISEFIVKEGVLHINIKKDESKASKSIWQKIDNIKLLPTLKVYVSIKDVKSLSVNGNGKLITENSIAADDLKVLVAGPGSMDIDIKSKNLSAKLAGSGNLEISGYSNSLSVENSGSGNINAYNFEVKTAKSSLYGSGSIEINVSESLDAKIYGSGHTFVKGATKEIKSQEYGEGEVERKN